MYSVDLDLSREQVKQLKQLALNCDLPVRGLVTKLVVTAIASSEQSQLPKSRVTNKSKIKIKEDE